MNQSSRSLSIVDQAICLNLDFDSRSIEGFTTVRFKIFKGALRHNTLEIRLCAKQMRISSIELDELQLYHAQSKDVKTFPNKVLLKTINYPPPEKQLFLIQQHLNSVPKNLHSIK